MLQFLITKFAGGVGQRVAVAMVASTSLTTAVAGPMAVQSMRARDNSQVAADELDQAAGPGNEETAFGGGSLLQPDAGPLGNGAEPISQPAGTEANGGSAVESVESPLARVRTAEPGEVVVPAPGNLTDGAESGVRGPVVVVTVPGAPSTGPGLPSLTPTTSRGQGSTVTVPGSQEGPGLGDVVVAPGPVTDSPASSLPTTVSPSTAVPGAPAGPATSISPKEPSDPTGSNTTPSFPDPMDETDPNTPDPVTEPGTSAPTPSTASPTVPDNDPSEADPRVAPATTSPAPEDGDDDNDSPGDDSSDDTAPDDGGAERDPDDSDASDPEDRNDGKDGGDSESNDPDGAGSSDDDPSSGGDSSDDGDDAGSGAEGTDSGVDDADDLDGSDGSDREESDDRGDSNPDDSNDSDPSADDDRASDGDVPDGGDRSDRSDRDPGSGNDDGAGEDDDAEAGPPTLDSLWVLVGDDEVARPLADAELFGDVTVFASAADGSEVEFLLDGASFGVGTALDFSADSLEPGRHTVTVRSRVVDGRQRERETTFTVISPGKSANSQ